MDKENAKGAAQKTKAELEEAAGKILEEAKLELKGKADQIGGLVRDAVGTAKDAMKDKELELKEKADKLAGVVRHAVGTAKDAIKDAVEEAKKI